MRHLKWVVLLALAAFGDPAAAQTQAMREIAARVELHAIPSLTLSDQQFLAGDQGGTPVTVTGELRIAQGSGRLPVVLLMHGSGGVGPNIDYWVRLLNGMGVSTFVIDGFTGRGLASVNTDQARLGRLNFILDIYRSLDILARHPRVDPERIVLMGFSRGGQAALYASLDRFHEQWNSSGARFAAYISFYPDCATTYRRDAETGSRPIRIFHGEADDYNPLRTCAAYVERLRAAGRDVAIATYPDAHHGFDTPLGTTATPSRGAQSVRECTIREADGGTLINVATQAPFTYRDACVALDPHVGGNAAAREAVTVAVRDFVRSVLRLE